MKPAREEKGGRGRRAIDGATGVERVTITLTAEDREALRRLGGSAWIRKAIRESEDAARWAWLRDHTHEIALGRAAMHLKASTHQTVSDRALERAVDRLRAV